MIESWNELWLPNAIPKKSSIKIAAFLKKQSRWSSKSPPPSPTKNPTADTFAKIGGGFAHGGNSQAQELRIIERLDVHIRQLGKTITCRGFGVWGYQKPYRCCLQWWVNHPKNGWWPIMQKTPINPWRIWGVPFFFGNTTYRWGVWWYSFWACSFHRFPSMNFLAKFMWSNCYESYLTNLKKTLKEWLLFNWINSRDDITGHVTLIWPNLHVHITQTLVLWRCSWLTFVTYKMAEMFSPRLKPIHFWPWMLVLFFLPCKTLIKAKWRFDDRSWSMLHLKKNKQIMINRCIGLSLSQWQRWKWLFFSWSQSMLLQKPNKLWCSNFFKANYDNYDLIG